MSEDLYNLSKKLKVRAEVLRKRLEEATGEKQSLGDPLPPEQVELLEKEFERPSAARRWLRQMGERLHPSGSEPVPEIPASVESPPKTIDEAVDANLISELMGDEETPEPSSEDLLPTLFEKIVEIPPIPDLDLGSEIVESIESVGDGEEETASSEDPGVDPAPEEEDDEEAAIPEGDLGDLLDEIPHEASPDAGWGEVDESIDLVSDLEKIGEIRDKLPDEISDFDFSDADFDMEEEESEEEVPLAGGSAGDGLTRLDDDEDESVSSEDLQGMVDNLFQELPEAVEAQEVHPPSILEKATRPATDFWNGLETKERVLLQVGATVAIFLIAGALHWSSIQYGADADLRLYNKGLRAQTEGNHKEALSLYGELLRRYPESALNSEASFRTAEVLRKDGEFTNAARAMNQGLKQLGDQVKDVSGEWTEESRQKLWKGLHFLGEVHALRQDWSNAAEHFNEVIRNASDDSLNQRSKYQYADVLYELARPEDAETALLRNVIKAYEIALDASAETTRILPTYRHLAQTWERLADREKGELQANLARSLEYLEKLRQFGEGTQLAGIAPMEVDLEVGRILREMGKNEESIQLLRKIIAMPRDEFLEGPLPHKYSLGLARSLVHRAEEFAETGKEASAELDLYEVLEIAKPNEKSPFVGDDNTEAAYLRGHSYYNLGILLSRKTGDTQNSQFTKMVAAYQNALEQNNFYGKAGRDSLLGLLRRTNYLYDNVSQYNDAVRDYSRILEEFPDNPYSYRVQYKLGDALYRLKRYDEAEKYFRDAVRDFTRTKYTDDESFRGAYFGLATCQYLQEDYARAAQTYETLLSLVHYEDSPESLLAWKRLADSYHQQGLIDESVEELQGFLEKHPGRDENSLVRFQLARNLFERFDYEEGREELRKIIKDLPRTNETVRWAHYLLCKSYQDQSSLAVGEDRNKLLQNVLAEAEKIRIAYPDEDQPLAIIGLTYFDLGDYERSAKYLEYFNQASRKEHPPAEYQLKLAESFFRLKRYPDAISAYRKVDLDDFAVGGREEAARTLFNLAESLRYEDRLTEAVANYQQILDDYPASTLRELTEGRINELQWRISKGISRQTNP